MIIHCQIVITAVSWKGLCCRSQRGPQPSGLSPAGGQAGRQAGRQRLLSVVPAPTPTPTPVPSPALLPESPGLTFARSGGGEVRTIHSAGPRSIAPFKCRKLSGQVGAFDFASSFSLMNGFFFFLSPISPNLRLPPPNCREGRRERGRDGRRMCEKQAFFSRQKESPPFPDPGNPTTPFENHGHA